MTLKEKEKIEGELAEMNCGDGCITVEKLTH